MIRFRFREDERRFILLHSEMFEKLARAGLSEVVGSDTLRNVGKVEQMAYMEGIRQGLAMATLANEMIQAEMGAIHEPHTQKAFQLHALIYGSSDTPLRDVEKEWLSKLGLDADHFAKSWLDDKPMRYAPATLRELEGNAPPIAPMVSVKAAAKPMPVKPFDPTTSPGMTDLMIPPEDVDAILDPPSRTLAELKRRGLLAEQDTPADLVAAMDALDRLPPAKAMHGAEVTVPEPWQKGEYEPDDPKDEEVQPESPEFLDIARGAIQTMKRGGWDPKTWQDLILGLHRHMGVDAGFLDIQLTTHVGRTVLDQCGLVGMAPPEMVSFDFFSGGDDKAPTLISRAADEDP